MDVAQLRSDTPSTNNILFLDNAGASLPPRSVTAAVNTYLAREADVGGYRAAEEERGLFQGVYREIGELLGGSATNIALIENATRAWQVACCSINFEDGDVVLVSTTEYASNYIQLMRLQEILEFEIQVIPNEPSGEVSVEGLKDLLTEKVKLVSIVHMPTNGGLLNPAEAIGDVLENHPAIYLLDACQTVGQYPLDVTKLKCDFLCGTGRKYLRGPRGTGFLYVRNPDSDTTKPLLLDLHGAKWIGTSEYTLSNSADRYEVWEKNYAGYTGLNEAVKYAIGIGLENIWERVRTLGGMLRENLASIPAVEVHDIGKEKGGIVTFSVAGRDPQEIKEELFRSDCVVSTSTIRSARLDMESRGLEHIVRASVHYYNTEDEVGRFIDLVTAV